MTVEAYRYSNANLQQRLHTYREAVCFSETRKTSEPSSYWTRPRGRSQDESSMQHIAW